MKQMPRLVLCFALIISAGIAKFAWAAEPGAERLVRLNVAATDSKGDPVTDLNASDVRVREDGQVHPTVFFRFAGPKRVPLPIKAGEIDNHPEAIPTIVLLDRWNEQFSTSASAWIDLGAALRNNESAENIFIYFLTNHGDLFPVNPLPPADTDLRAAKPLTPEELRAKLDDAVRKLNGLRSVDVLDPILKANTTLKALDALAADTSAIAGRKNLVWVTHGFPLSVRLPGADWIDFTPQVRALSGGATLAQIAIYPVDQSSQGAGAQMGTLAQQTLQLFASLTGGRWYPSNNTSDALAGAVADSRGNYRMAYRSPIREKDKKEHKIHLESMRKGVRLLTREGYFGDFRDPDPDLLERVLLTNESHSPFDATEIAVRAASSAGAAGKSHLAIRIDPVDVLLEKQGEKYEADLAVMFAFYGGDVLKSTSQPVRLSFGLTEDQFNQAQNGGVSFSQDVAVESGVDQIRVMVFDRKLYALGSVTLRAPK